MKHVDALRGTGRLAFEATQGVIDVVAAMHKAIGAVPLVTDVVYGGIRGVTGVVGHGIDGALAQLAPLVATGAPSLEGAALLAVLNGVLGDYLAESGNPLALPMSFCHGGRPLAIEAAALRAALPDAGARVLVLVHGSSLNDRSWQRRGHDHGAALARDRGWTAIYLRYNSGLHISANGRAFAEMLERLVAGWPVPLHELAILGHSMGGLVARSACDVGARAGHAWRARLGRLVCLGSPHHGAPLERGGNWVDLILGASPYTAPIGRLARIRSAGVTDLRHGNVRDEDWHGRDRFAHAHDTRVPLALPDGVSCYAIAGTLSPTPGARLRGDGLVPVDSALGRHGRPGLTLAFPEAHTLIAYGAGHLDLLERADVYEQLRAWL